MRHDRVQVIEVHRIVDEVATVLVHVPAGTNSAEQLALAVQVADAENAWKMANERTLRITSVHTLSVDLSEG
jgi:hypothetical protein